MKLTADTITDAQINELRDDPYPWPIIVRAALAVVGPLKRQRQRARARCAELLNARSTT